MSGPLTGVRVLEFGGIGPGPFAGMLLADLGAEVIRLERSRTRLEDDAHAVLFRSRRSLGIDLKDSRGAEIALRLIERSDALIEGYRPGVMERLGLGPDEALERNPAIVYARMTGWGQDGPASQRAGHDINYIAIAGALEPLAGGSGRPTPPLNMLGDFGGGGMLLVTGLLAALLHARTTGQGQVVDAAIVDGVALQTGMLQAMQARGHWPGPRGENLFDGGAPFYGVYETSDGGWLALGAIEPQFYASLVEGLGLGAEAGSVQYDRAAWPTLRQLFADRIATRTRADWVAVFEGTDACVSPVLAPEEVLNDPHLSARGTYLRPDAVRPSEASAAAGAPEPIHPAPAPRFSRTKLDAPRAVVARGADTRVVLEELGFGAEEIGALVADGVVRG